MDRRRILPPGFIEPCIPSLAFKPPAGPGWVHEIKHDGYRLIVRRDGETVRLFTRLNYGPGIRSHGRPSQGALSNGKREEDMDHKIVGLKLSGLRRYLPMIPPDFSLMPRGSIVGLMLRVITWASAVRDAIPGSVGVEETRRTWRNRCFRPRYEWNCRTLGSCSAQTRQPRAHRPAGVFGVGDGSSAVGVRGE